jgi:hypothetical protein
MLWTSNGKTKGVFMKKIIVAIIVCMTFAFGANGSGVFIKVGVTKGGIKGDGVTEFH